MERNHPHLAGLILARGGSRGIPLKNLSRLGGRPLLQWSLDAMIQKPTPFDSVWVSTDHDAIAACAKSYAPQVSVFRRSPKFATDDAPSISAVQVCNVHSYNFQSLLQLKHPFRSSWNGGRRLT